MLPTSPASAGPPNVKSSERTARACDLCRQMKIKCDGTNPCKHCQTSFNDCIYSEPRRKKRKIATEEPDRLQYLEARLKAMEDSYQKLAAEKSSTASNTPISQPVVSQSPAFEMPTTSGEVESGASQINQQNDSNQHGEARFLGSSAERAFIDRLKAEVGDSTGVDFESRLRLRDRTLPKLFQSEPPATLSAPLPPKERAEHLIRIALDAHILYHVIHRPTFDLIFNLLYSLEPLEYGDEETKHTPLVYSLMALGCIFESQNEMPSDEREKIRKEGMEYFSKSRSLVDLVEPEDIVTLQAIFYLNLFLMNTGRLSPCYTYLSYMLSLAYRMNLHQPLDSSDMIAAEIAKRLFWSIRQLLTFLAAICGLPKPVSDGDVELEYPLDINDTDLELSRVSSRPRAIKNSRVSTGLRPYLELHHILDDIIKDLYLRTGFKSGKGSTSRNVCVDTIVRLQQTLQAWVDSLPNSCRLGREKGSPSTERAKYELCMIYSHVQMYLYRPFLHYLVPHIRNGLSGADFQIYASACIEASCNIIHLAQDMLLNKILCEGGLWRVVHMVFTSTMSLLYIIHGCKGTEMAKKLLIDLNLAKKILLMLRPYCLQAQRSLVIFTIMTTAFGSPIQISSIDPTNEAQSQTIGPQEPKESYTAALADQTFNITARSSFQRDSNSALLSILGVANSTSYTPSAFNTALSQQLPLISSSSSLLPATNPIDDPSSVTNATEPPGQSFADNTNYLEARPFSLRQNKEPTDDFFLQLLNSEAIDLDEMGRYLPSFNDLF